MDESVSVIKLIMRKLVERSEDNYCTLNVILHVHDSMVDKLKLSTSCIIYSSCQLSNLLALNNCPYH